jgi:hypothetical protein
VGGHTRWQRRPQNVLLFAGRCNWAIVKTLCDVFEFMIMWEQQMYDSEYQQKVLDVRR